MILKQPFIGGLGRTFPTSILELPWLRNQGLQSASKKHHGGVQFAEMDIQSASVGPEDLGRACLVKNADVVREPLSRKLVFRWLRSYRDPNR